MKRIKYDISSSGLHLLGMLFMGLDHIWATQTPNQVWMTCLGRLAFPIFAFLVVVGYFHTHNLKLYLLRMLLFAVISEMPFDRMYSGLWFYPYHQNTIWTLLISLVCITLLEKVRKMQGKWITISYSVLIVLTGFLLATVCMSDFYGTGVLTVMTFYFLRQRNWKCFLGQLAILYWMNAEVLGGLYYPITIGGHQFELVQQSLALLALIPIWLFRGRKGSTGKVFQYFCYAFYPLHCLVLSFL